MTTITDALNGLYQRARALKIDLSDKDDEDIIILALNTLDLEKLFGIEKLVQSYPLTFIDREEVDKYGGQGLRLKDVAEAMVGTDAFTEQYWLSMRYAVEKLLER